MSYFFVDDYRINNFIILLFGILYIHMKEIIIKGCCIAIICISIVFMILIGTSVIKIENKNTRNDVGLGIGIGGIFLPIVFGFVYTFA